MKKTLTMTTSLLMLLSAVACSSSGSGRGADASSNQGNVAPVTSPDLQPSGNTTDDVNKPDDGKKKTITFSTFFPDHNFEEAKKGYEALHPNIEIKLTSVQSDNQHLEQALEKYVKETNTAMLAAGARICWKWIRFLKTATSRKDFSRIRAR